MCVLYSCRALPSIQILGQTLRCTFCPNVGHDSCHAAGKQLLLLLCAACAHPYWTKQEPRENTLACINISNWPPPPTDEVTTFHQKGRDNSDQAAVDRPQPAHLKKLERWRFRVWWWYVALHQQKWIHPYSVTGENLIAKVPWRGSNRISSRPKKWQSTDQCIQRRSCCPKVPHNLPHDSHGWLWWVSHASRKFWRKHEEMNGNDVNTDNEFSELYGWKVCSGERPGATLLERLHSISQTNIAILFPFVCSLAMGSGLVPVKTPAVVATWHNNNDLHPWSQIADNDPESWLSKTSISISGFFLVCTKRITPWFHMPGHFGSWSTFALAIPRAKGSVFAFQGATMCHGAMCNKQSWGTHTRHLWPPNCGTQTHLRYHISVGKT